MSRVRARSGGAENKIFFLPISPLPILFVRPQARFFAKTVGFQAVVFN